MKLERKLYKAGWITLLLSLAVAALLYYLIIKLHIVFPKCMFLAMTGFYCPGCGGTRAAAYFFMGHWIRSFLYHPLVLYSALLYIWFMGSHTIELLSKEKYKVGMKFQDAYIWIALGILALNFIIKNLMLHVWDIRFL